MSINAEEDQEDDLLNRKLEVAQIADDTLKVVAGPRIEGVVNATLSYGLNRLIEDYFEKKVITEKNIDHKVELTLASLKPLIELTYRQFALKCKDSDAKRRSSSCSPKT